MKLGQKIFVVYVIVLCMLPICLMPFTKSQLAENRTLAQAPRLFVEDQLNRNFFNECSDYVADHFAMRSQLVAFDGELKYRIFHTPSDKQVVLGKKDWLFFDGTLADYAGVTLSEEKIEDIAEGLEEVTQYFDALGKQVIFMIVPNKNTIYAEYMPDQFGKQASVTNRTLLQKKMEEKQIPYLDAAAVLSAYKETDEVYLHQDTHWNNTGARLVLNALYEKAGIAFAYSLDGYQVEQSHESDLSKIIFPTKENLESQRIYDPVSQFAYNKRMRNIDDLNITSISEEPKTGKTVFLYRDSFGRAMIPYMSEVFAKGEYNRSTPYDMTLAGESDCDLVIIEIVERNIADLELCKNSIYN